MKSAGWQSGFDSVVQRRATMQHWSHLQTLMSYGANREAAAIVQSFQAQIDFETYQECVERVAS